MSRIKKIIIILVISAAFFSCGDKFKPATDDNESENSPSQESWNSTVVFSDSGNVKAVLTAGHISVFTAKGYTLIDSGAKVEFYRDGKYCPAAGQEFSRAQMIEFYQDLAKRFPIISIEDPFAEDDWEGWKKMFSAFAAKNPHIRG